ncbi:hypothetical protein ACIHFD_56520 [Nonomuraea sp. NPDC051941]|uniref:hypothetical protein n=1 Tax=Nonomuraea sp. NPDC051941 TaxID=3364373 RepID=UPI0037C7C59D
MNGRPRRRNLDLIEHLDDSGCLIEVNLQLGGDAHVEVMYTDLQGETHTGKFTADQAWIVADIIMQFDRRGVREFAQLLVEGVHEINADPEVTE